MNDYNNNYRSIKTSSEYANDNGVMIGKGGSLGNVLRINPPLCIQKEDVDYVADVLDQGFQQL
jgi:4-aminobutyrate aminotransferase-like enzyme